MFMAVQASSAPPPCPYAKAVRRGDGWQQTSAYLLGWKKCSKSFRLLCSSCLPTNHPTQASKHQQSPAFSPVEALPLMRCLPKTSSCARRCHQGWWECQLLVHPPKVCPAIFRDQCLAVKSILSQSRSSRCYRVWWLTGADSSCTERTRTSMPGTRLQPSSIREAMASVQPVWDSYRMQILPMIAMRLRQLYDFTQQWNEDSSLK